MISFDHLWNQFSQEMNMTVIWPVHLSIPFSAGNGTLCLIEKSLFSHCNIFRSEDHYTHFLGKQNQDLEESSKLLKTI